MRDFIRQHELWALAIMFVICCVCGLLVWHFERWRDRKALLDTAPGQTSAIWQIARFQGGASVWTPEPMTEMDACTWAKALGAIAWVDRAHRKIFIR